jgi:hypothetical protein
MSQAARKLFTRVVTPVAVAACAVAVAVPASTAAQPARHTNAAVAHTAFHPGKYATHVTGSFGKYGRVTGHFKPLRSFVRNGKTVVQGDLMTTMRRSNGQLVGHVTRRDVIVPVHASGAHTSRTAAAAAASCSVLHLVLGPLNLNLLGLAVHLNRVVLDITAIPGAGNLLGNLLCAVANLLNNTSPTLADLYKLSSLLSQIIGMLT